MVSVVFGVSTSGNPQLAFPNCSWYKNIFVYGSYLAYSKSIDPNYKTRSYKGTNVVNEVADVHILKRIDERIIPD